MDVYIRMLRRKIDDPWPIKLIQTVRGAGYTLRVPGVRGRVMKGSISLRNQLILWNAVTLALLLTALGLVTRFTAASAIMSSVDRSLEERTHPPPQNRQPHYRPPPDRSGDGPPMAQPEGGRPPGDGFDAARRRSN